VSDDDNGHFRQGATANAGSRPRRATESATKLLNNDPALAVVMAAWPELPDSVKAEVVAMIKVVRMTGV
jgi:hypothetical protein